MKGKSSPAKTMLVKAAILIVSTRRSDNPEQDESGPVIREILQKAGAEVVDYTVISDDKERITSYLSDMAASGNVNLVLTSGGTGLSRDDVTPEATLAVIERRLSGFEELMRIKGFEKTPYAILSRAVVGTLGPVLIINLPGSPKGSRDNLELVMPAIPHAVRVLGGHKIHDSEHRFKMTD